MQKKLREKYFQNSTVNFTGFSNSLLIKEKKRTKQAPTTTTLASL